MLKAICTGLSLGLWLLFMSNAVLAEVNFAVVEHDLPTLDAPVVIDGVIDEPQWQQALRIELMYETEPDENTPARQKTTAYIYADGEHLNVAFRAEDTNVGLLRAYMRDRDASFDDDHVGIQIDTFNDEQRSYRFFVNPFGAQMDLLFDESSGNADDAWDAIWASAGSIDANGYTVEMAIPFGNLRFESGSQAKTWGFEVSRVHPRDQKRVYKNTPRDRNKNCTLCQLHKFRGLNSARQGNQIELNPVLTVAKNESRNAAGRMVSNGTKYEPGLNFKWGITPELTLDATLNPDFSQVESDSARLTVNETFALFFDEKRPFFQEGSNFFNTDIDVVYTRNVTEPEYGAKLTGRTNAHTFGTFVARDEITNILIPGTFGSGFATLNEKADVFAGRYRYDFNPGLNLGLVSTYRDAGDYSNLVVGVDGFYRWKERHQLVAHYVQSATDNPAALQTDFGLPEKQDGSAFHMKYDYSSRDWFQYIGYSDFGKDFRADLGFVTQVNYDRWVVGGGRVLFSENSWWKRIELSSDWGITHDRNGRVLQREVEGRIEVNGPMQSYLQTGIIRRDRLFANILFDERFLNGYFQITPWRGLLLEIGANGGDRIDFSSARLGKNIRLNPGLHYSVNKHTQLFLHYTYDRIKVAGLKERIAHLTDLKLTYQFNTRSFLRLTAQVQNIKTQSDDGLNPLPLDRARSFNKQLLYSYKVNPRTVFFLGYSDLADSNNDRPHFQQQERGLFMKLGYVLDY